jgi:hypothetical protein
VLTVPLTGTGVVRSWVSVRGFRPVLAATVPLTVTGTALDLNWVLVKGPATGCEEGKFETSTVDAVPPPPPEDPPPPVPFDVNNLVILLGGEKERFAPAPCGIFHA